MKLYKLLFLLIAIGFSSCDLEEVNIDPSRPSDVDLSLQLPETIAQTAYNQSSSTARVIGIVLEQFLGTDAQQIAFGNYVISTQTFNNYWRTGFFAGSGRSANLIIQKATDENAPHFRGIARIMMATSLFEATSMFGDLPYSEAFQGEANFQPAYDTQESILATIDQLLNDGIADMNMDAGPVAPGPGSDLIFSGDAASWIAYANALKARIQIQTLNRGGTAAGALAALEDAFQSAADQPNFTWDATLQGGNPIGKFANDRPGTMAFNGAFVQRLRDNFDDPRQATYFNPVIDEDTGEETGYNFEGGPVWSALGATIPLISYVELKFIEAEARWRLGESEAAQMALAEAITESLALNGVSDPGDFVSQASDLSGLGAEAGIEKIITQAYMSYYGIAFHQSWNNFRRTGYPAITPAANGSNGNNPSGVVPLRWLYPDSEFTANSANVQAAIDRQGGQLQDNPLWMFGG